MENQQKYILKSILSNHLKNSFSIKYFNDHDWYNNYKKEVKNSKYLDYSDDIDFDFNFGKSKLSLLPTSFFASTSGFNCKIKIIPHSRRSLNNYFTSSFSLFKNIVSQQGFLNLVGKNLLVTGKSFDSFSPQNIPIGSISGKIASKIYRLAPFFFTYSPDKVSNLEPIQRYKSILDSFNPDKVIGVVGTNPFIIHKFLSDKLSLNSFENNDLVYSDLNKGYPKLKYVICLNGHPMKWHTMQLQKAFNNTIKFYDPGIGASEGIFTSGGFSNETIGFPVINNKSQFIEYMPLNGVPLFANYDIREFLGSMVEPLITTDYGFKRYTIEDTYEVIKYKDKIILEFKGKKDKVFSFASERVYESNIHDLMKKYSIISNIEITDYVFYFEKATGNLGRYVFVISTNDYRLKEVKRELFQESNLLDKLFQEINPEYRNSRNSNFILPATVKIDNNFIPALRTNKFCLNKQEKEQIFIDSIY